MKRQQSNDGEDLEAVDQSEQPLTTGVDGEVPRSSVPVGAWRDGIFNICKRGPCHCSVLNSCCCTLIGTTQVSSRLGLTYMGKPGSLSAAAGAFRQMLMIVVAYWTTRAFMLLLIAIADPNVGSKVYKEPPPSYYFFCAVDDLIFYFYVIFTVVVVANVRKQVRSKYAIPEACPLEDACLSCWCPCLVASQMMRHTADYEKYPGRCCTETGLPPHAPSIL